MLNELPKADFRRRGALQKISSSALESFDVMCWGCAGVIGGVLLTRGKDAEQCLLCSPLGFGGWGGKGNSQRPASVSGHKQCFERDRPLLYVSTGWMAKKCLVRYRKMNRRGMRMKTGV